MVKTKPVAVGTYYILILLALFSCSNNKNFPSWLIGSWHSKYEGIDIDETWCAKDGTYIGKTIWTLDNHKRFEKLTLFFNSKNELVYRVEIDSKAVDFVCSETDKDSLIFVNPQNDFPKRLIYVKPKGKNMLVYIDNSENDPNRMTFHFSRSK